MFRLPRAGLLALSALLTAAAVGTPVAAAAAADSRSGISQQPYAFTKIVVQYAG